MHTQFTVGCTSCACAPSCVTSIHGVIHAVPICSSTNHTSGTTYVRTSHRHASRLHGKVVGHGYGVGVETSLTSTTCLPRVTSHGASKHVPHDPIISTFLCQTQISATAAVSNFHLLEVLVVCCGCALQHRKAASKVTLQLASLTPAAEISTAQGSIA
jgi:hypothetical protein